MLFLCSLPGIKEMRVKQRLMILVVFGVAYFTSNAQGTYEVNTDSARTKII